jgi:hypothetical protein
MDMSQKRVVNVRFMDRSLSSVRQRSELAHHTVDRNVSQENIAQKNNLFAHAGARLATGVRRSAAGGWRGEFVG